MFIITKTVYGFTYYWSDGSANGRTWQGLVSNATKLNNKQFDTVMGTLLKDDTIPSQYKFIKL